MPDLSNQAHADRVLVADPAAKALRAKLAPYLALLRPQLTTLSAHLPSYVAVPLAALVQGVDQWERDEKTV